MGMELGERFEKLLPFLKIGPGMKMLDIGSGRGELCLYAARMGAEAMGIDYSEAAIDLSNQARRKLPVQQRKLVKFVNSRVTRMKLPDNYFDLAVCVEVLEHLYPEEIDGMLTLLDKALKPGARVVFHTAPNRWFNDFGYRYWSYPVGSLLIGIWNRLKTRQYPPMQLPSQLRTDSHRVMHINEPTWFSLKRHFNRLKWDYSIQSMNITMVKPVISWKDTLFNALAFLHPLSKKFPLNIFLGDDYLILVTKRKH
jgi:cyclopropane fatty-acyl-phospholipid synthase-like methyltransferase